MAELIAWLARRLVDDPEVASPARCVPSRGRGEHGRTAASCSRSPRTEPVVADELVPVGRVGRPHGLDGAFVVERPSDDDARFAVGATLHVDGEPFEIVLSRRVGGGRRAIRLDRAPPRGATLAVPRSQLPEPEAGHYYVFQLVGLTAVEEGGRQLGLVRDVLPGPANDNLELDSGSLVPLIEDAIVEIDVDSGRVVVARGFSTDGYPR
jgi:16S rRNA processing protein RimM